MTKKIYKNDVIIIGGGLAGLSAALELLEFGKSVTILDRDIAENFGGLAKKSFGGMFFVNTPHQKRSGIKDNPKLALEDWHSFAEFDHSDEWPKKWAESYVHNSLPEVYYWLISKKVKFFPVVHWVERGMFKPGNSVPRFHMVWGTGKGLTDALIEVLQIYIDKKQLCCLFEHHVQGLSKGNNRITGCHGHDIQNNIEFECHSDAVIVATGGINGDIELVRKHWNQQRYNEAPEVILNGSHDFANGELHKAVEKSDGQVTHLNRMWNYAAGVHHPYPTRKLDGLSLVPTKSALWTNSNGKRIGPVPLVTSYDTSYLVEKVCQEPGQYSWQVLNWKIACKELAVSGSEFNDAIRDKKLIKFILTVLTGNEKLVQTLSEDCIDFVTARTISDLARKMNTLSYGNHTVDPKLLESEIQKYDANIDRGSKFRNDDQLRRINHLRQYKGDRLRTCKFQKILDPKAMPLIAIRLHILSRKSLGGIQTDLESRVLDHKGQPISGLYATGEAAGFGGGGMHGHRALEGTFLGGCVLTGRMAAKSIAGK